jgi:hypothetical protein
MYSNQTINKVNLVVKSIVHSIANLEHQRNKKQSVQRQTENRLITNSSQIGREGSTTFTSEINSRVLHLHDPSAQS